MTLIRDFTFKIILLGNWGVGKSSIRNRYIGNEFNKTGMVRLGPIFQVKSISIDGKKIKLQIWDTADQERFNQITKLYYQSAQGALLVYDVTDRQSFDAIEGWVEALKKNTDEHVVKILVGNKIDLEESRKVTYDKGEELAKKLGVEFFEVSAKTPDNINICFETLVRLILKK